MEVQTNSASVRSWYSPLIGSSCPWCCVWLPSLWTRLIEELSKPFRTVRPAASWGEEPLHLSRGESMTLSAGATVGQLCLRLTVRCLPLPSKGQTEVVLVLGLDIFGTDHCVERLVDRSWGFDSRQLDSICIEPSTVDSESVLLQTR
jgi:hypothetical protein